MLAAPATSADVDDVLRKTLRNGCLKRIPRHPARRDTLLALIALRMRRRHAYSEVELNELLRSRLALLRAEVDHVTCRRFLVDLGFVKRDAAGNRYILNYPRLEASLADEVIGARQDPLQEAIPSRRESLASLICRAADGA